MLSHINIASGENITIKELTELIKDVVGFTGKISFDETKPDGSPNKAIDISLLSKIGWKPKNSLRVGLEKTYNHFLNMQ